MFPNPQLEGMIAREDYAELLACLTPGQLAVVALRLDDLRYDQVAELLGLTRQGVYYRMSGARRRLAARCPHRLRSRVHTGLGESMWHQPGRAGAGDVKEPVLGAEWKSRCRGRGGRAGAGGRVEGAMLGKDWKLLKATEIEEDPMADPIVLDAAANLRTLDWLRTKYGPFVIHTPPPLEPGEESLGWRITALRERIDAPATIVVRTSYLDGTPAPRVKVAWYWPDAPVDLDCGPVGAPFEGVTAHSCVSGTSSGDGYAGFAMGDGAYYYADRGERGPHAVWIHGAETRSDLLLGLGMLPGTNHDHFDVEFSLVHDSSEEPEDPETEGLSHWFSEIVEQLTRIACALQDARPALQDARPDQEAPTHG